MGWMQSSGGVHIVVAMAKVSSWMGLMQTHGGVHMGIDTIAVAATQCEQALRARSHLATTTQIFDVVSMSSEMGCIVINETVHTWRQKNTSLSSSVNGLYSANCERETEKLSVAFSHVWLVLVEFS